jgi:hypothetical protein
MMPNFDVLGSLVVTLHQEFVQIYYLILPVFFALALLVGWAKNPAGGVDFLDTLKRAVIATLLLVAFQDISQGILFVADGIAEKIDNMSGLNSVLQMAAEKSKGYSHSPVSLLLQFDDFIIAMLSFASYLVLYFARYITVAMYYFFWIFLSISSPLLLLFNLFPSTSNITVNLFKSMCEVASWKICWAILSAMLTALSFGDIYKTDGDYITLIVMNFVIAVAMLATPMMVRALANQGVAAMAPALGAAAVATMAAAPGKLATTFVKGRSELNLISGFANQKISALKNRLGSSNPSRRSNDSDQT